MTEAAVKIKIARAPSMVSIDTWDEFIPEFRGHVAMRSEPRRWWLRADEDAIASLERQLEGHGVVTPISGGLVCASLVGIGWREVLMSGGWFDAESPSFTVGDCVGTLLGHVSVRLHILSEAQCDVYFAASYREAIEHHLQRVMEAAS